MRMLLLFMLLLASFGLCAASSLGKFASLPSYL